MDIYATLDLFVEREADFKIPGEKTREMISTSAASLCGDDLVSKASSLVAFLQDNAGEIDRSGLLPGDVLAAMEDAGVFKIGVAERFGGLGFIPLRTESDVLIELGKGDASAGWLALLGWGTSKFVSLGWPPEVAEEVFDPGHLGPPVAGAVSGNPAISKSVGRAIDGGFMVSGRWAFASGVRQSAWLMAGSDLTDGTGTTRRAIVLIPRSEFEIADDWHVEGMKGTNSNTAYVTDEVFVPTARVLPMSEFIERVLPRLAVNAVFFPSIVLGCAMAALDCFIGKVNRGAFGTPYRTLAEMPAVQIATGRVRADIGLLEAALRRSTEMVDRAQAGEIELTPADRAVFRYEQVRGANLLRTDVEELQHAVGSSTAVETDKLGRYCRDIRVMSLQVQMRNDWGAEQAGRALLGLEPWPALFQDKQA